MIIDQISRIGRLIRHGSNKVAVDSATGTTFTGPVPALQQSPILNGGFNVWQAGTTFTGIANGAYGPDGWFYAVVGAAVHDLLRSTDVPAVADTAALGNYSLHLDCTTADASLAATDRSGIVATIEGYDFLPFAQRIFTVGFWVKAAKTGVHYVAARNGDVNRSCAMPYTVNAADTWEYKTVTFPASPSAGGWYYTNVIGLYLSWELAAGSNFHTTAGAWQTGNFTAASDIVNETDSAANNFKLYGVTMGLGSTVAPDYPRPFQQELARCQRYFCKTFPYATAPAQNAGTILGGLSYSAILATAIANSVQWRFPVPMRTAPTLTFYNPAAANAAWRNVTDGADSGAASTSGLGDSGVMVANAQAAGDGVGEILAIHATAAARL